MSCDQCGTQIANGAKFCPSCGKVLGNVRVMPAEGRLTRHLRLMAILWLAGGALNLLAAGGAWLVSRFVLVPLISKGVPGFVAPLVMGVATFIFVKAVACFATGWGLLERESWARVLALVLAFVSLLNFPLGTALGICTLWVLLPRTPKRSTAGWPRPPKVPSISLSSSLASPARGDVARHPILF